MQSNRPQYAALCCYFGQWPSHFAFWLKSCEYNPDIDFLLVSDIAIDGYTIPRNVQLHRMTFAEAQKRIHDLFDPELSPSACIVDRPYKLCDYKTAFGYIFADLFEGYDYWGYYDIDTIWGNIPKFIPENQDNHLVKVFPCGHLSFIRNQAPYDQIFRLVNQVAGTPCRNNMAGKQVSTWQQCFTSSQSHYYDEEGGLEPWFEAHPELAVYSSVDFDNILPPWRFDHFFSINFPQKSRFLAYSFDRGTLSRHYLRGFRTFTEEVSYLHASKRKFKILSEASDQFQIRPNSITDGAQWSYFRLLWFARPRYLRRIACRILQKLFPRISN